MRFCDFLIVTHSAIWHTVSKTISVGIHHIWRRLLHLRALLYIDTHLSGKEIYLRVSFGEFRDLLDIALVTGAEQKVTTISQNCKTTRIPKVKFKTKFLKQKKKYFMNYKWNQL